MRRPVDARDRELIARFQAGDGRAFDELVAAYEASTARLAQRLLGWQADVDDIVQDVFVSVLEHLDRFRGESRFSTWLASITVNCCRAHRRRERMSLRHLFGMWQATRGRNTGTADADADTHERVRRAVRRLPATHSEPLVLRYFQELSISEISEVLGLSANTVEVRLSRARQRLRQMLEGAARGALE